MSKKIFDMRANFVKMDRLYMHAFFNFPLNICAAPWLICFNTHSPKTCERARILSEFMWTRKR